MNTTVSNAAEYRNLPFASLTESKTNPRRSFEQNALQELAKTIQVHGVLSPLPVRPLPWAPTGLFGTWFFEITIGLPTTLPEPGNEPFAPNR